MPKKRVLVVDDNCAVRSFVRQLFELEPDFEISGEAENGHRPRTLLFGGIARSMPCHYVIDKERFGDHGVGFP